MYGLYNIGAGNHFIDIASDINTEKMENLDINKRGVYLYSLDANYVSTSDMVLSSSENVQYIRLTLYDMCTSFTWVQFVILNHLSSVLPMLNIKAAKKSTPCLHFEEQHLEYSTPLITTNCEIEIFLIEHRFWDS